MLLTIIATNREAADLDFKTSFDQLKKNGYNGFLTFECRVRSENPEQAYKDALAHLKSCLI